MSGVPQGSLLGPVLARSWNDWPVSLISIPEKVMEPLILGAISIHMDDTKANELVQHGFTKGK